ncbi:hypothetical protein TNCV_1013521 [Trichonephila clavipes]|uniref:Uncharacterized protein n=1 Tax=Trichonephila clavipes TaxID=2585209 RepID=A0A8X7B9V0_TRICX|nr:hypothetical protein TNCV_1013521 [Trichonephila clavipes]
MGSNSRLCKPRSDTYTTRLPRPLYRMGQIIPAFEIVRRIFLFPSLKGAPRFEPGTSRSAVECSTTKLYTPCQQTFALRFVGRDTKMPCLEIYRMG